MRKLLFAASLLGCMAFGHGGGTPCVVGKGAFTSAVLAPGPVVWYRCNELTGASMADSSGNARNGSYSGSPTLGSTGLTRDWGNCVNPNTSIVTASGKFGSVGTTSWINLDKFTLIVFVLSGATNGTNAFIFGSMGSALDSGFGVYRAANQTYFSALLYTSAGLENFNASTSITNGAAHMLTYLFNGTKVELHTDTAVDLAATSTSSTIITYSTSTVQVGATGGPAFDLPWNYNVSDCILYSYTITGAQETAIYNASVGLP